MQNATPMLRQYLEIKKQYPGTILFFRLGDFYEMFNDDAVLGSRELDITLTARQKNAENPIPMCGVPHHAAANYIARLVRKGYRVAICEQTEEASSEKKLVRREVVKIVTPGTAIDDQLLEKKEPVYLASVYGSGEDFGIALLELSTGEFLATSVSGTDAWQKAISEIESFGPREVLYPRSLRTLIATSFSGYVRDKNGSPPLFTEKKTSSTASGITTELEDAAYTYDDAVDRLKDQFGATELSGYGIEADKPAIAAAGACIHYAKETQKAAAEHVTGIEYYRSEDHMVLDAVTLRNLEIVAPSNPDLPSKRSLLGVIDETVTGMGGRLLRSWLLRPSLKVSEIEGRQKAIKEFEDSILRDSLRYLLKEIVDIERLVGRLNLGSATPRDLVSLRASLNRLPVLRSLLIDARSLLVQVLCESVNELPGLLDLLERSISEDPPVNLADGGVIREGFSNELDELRNIASNAKQTIAAFENAEKKRTGIGSLHIKFNNVFGYFIEISKANLSKAPDAYERRQTLTNSERFTTPQLKEWESKVLGAEERINELEAEIFSQIRSAVRKETRGLQSTARALATLDVLSALAETCTHRNYENPLLHEGDELTVKSGRHAVVEAYSGSTFVPNDLTMNNSTDRLLIITGANMGGKSTVLRQVALIQILAQIGSPVPASYAKLPIVDRIWTRVGASDDLASGRSTFMVEMTETAAILHNATPKSLVFLDEIGRGTSTFDGLAIAWAVAEHLHNSPEHSAKTLFATHYHELTELAEILPGARNYQMAASERDGDIIFLHKLEEGSASKSYGIAVAKLAGLPREVVERAKTVLKKLEEYELAVFSDERTPKTDNGLNAAAAKAGAAGNAAQVSLFAIANETAIDELREVNVGEMNETELRETIERIKNSIV